MNPSQKLTSRFTGTGTIGPVSVASNSERDDISLQVALTSTATISVQTKVDPDLPFVEVTTLSASGIVSLAKFSDIQLVVSANGGAIAASILT